MYNNKFDIVPEDRFRTISVTGEKIISIYISKYGIVEYADYSEELYNFLASKHLCGYRSPNRSRMYLSLNDTISQKRHFTSVGRCGFLFSRRCGKYDGFVTFIHDFPKLRNNLKGDNEDYNEIDHLNGDYHNHCMYNLSVIPKSKNVAKLNYTNVFAPPYYIYTAVNENGEYLIEFTIGARESVFYKCKNIDSLNNWLYIFQCKKPLTKHLKLYLVDDSGETMQLPNPREACSIIQRDIHADNIHAETLLAMDKLNDNRINIWTTVKKATPEICELFSVKAGTPVLLSLTPLESGDVNVM